MSAASISTILRRLGGFYGIYVPEFTYGGKRIDAAIIDVSKRWIRGFEIKVSRGDFLADEKWQDYAEFCSSLSIVCPEGLISKEEVPEPFGLLYILPESKLTSDFRNAGMKWEKKPKRFQRRDGLAWLYQYVRVIEKELPRLNIEVERLNKALVHADRRDTSQWQAEQVGGGP
jgi:hypothetical protein